MSALTSAFPRSLAFALAMTGVSMAIAAPVTAAGRVDLTGLHNDRQHSQFIVKYLDGSGPRKRAQALNSAIADAAAKVSPGAKAAGATRLKASALRRLAVGADVIKLDRELSPAQARAFMQALAADPALEYVEVDRILMPAMVPNDPLYFTQWAYSGVNGIRAEAAWDVSTGSGATIAIIDTGITAHADLSPNTIGGYDFISDAARARDGDGRDANPNDEGDWITGNNECGDNRAPRDSTWHGTHVAGIAAAAGHNGIGVAGTAYGARIVPVRVLGRCGGRSSDTADAIIWAAGGSVPGVPDNPHPAQVINLSLGSVGGCQTTTQNAIDRALQRGAVVVVAAGNNGHDVSNDQPANCAGVIAVAATTEAGDRPGFSNFGAGIDLAAPGASIYSTLNAGSTTQGAQSYAYASGTSMAAPYVAGVAALVRASARACLPTAPADIKALLKRTARPLPGTCPGGCGAGLLDASAAVAAARANQPPTVDLNAIVTNFTLDTLAYPYDCDGTIAHYIIDFGDGATSNSQTASHTYSAPGTYTITITVVDNEGAAGVFRRAYYISGSDST